MEGAKPAIEIDLTHRDGLSSPDKTPTVASTTWGNRPVGDIGMFLGLNTCVYPER